MLYLLRYERNNSFSSTELFNRIISWNNRKKEKYNKKDIDEMINFLSSKNIIKSDIFGNFSYVN